MPDQQDIRMVVDPTIAKALAHPIRMRILGALERGQASPVNLARALGEPLNTTAYHVRVLVDLGFLELVGTAKRRGALEHTYRLASRWTITHNAWDQLPPQAQASITTTVLRQVVVDDIGPASFAPAWTSLTRVVLHADDQARAELNELLTDTLDRARQIELASQDRAPGQGAGSELVLMLLEPRPVT